MGREFESDGEEIRAMTGALYLAELTQDVANIRRLLTPKE